MTAGQNNWLQKVAAGVVIGVFLFILHSQWRAVEALEINLANHREDAAKNYITRQEMILVIREILNNAPR